MNASSKSLDRTRTGPIPEVPGCNGLELLGVSATGAVYRGRQVAHARDVAIRVFVAGALGAQLRRVCEQAAALNHPNLVRIHQVGEHAGRHFCASEFLAGGSLASRFGAGASGGLPWREAVRIVSLAAAGLAHVHEKGLVHGAVRPSNVLVRPEGHVKLGDVGMVARTPEDPVESASVAPFVSPEEARGEEATAASDMYSLGATLYFALAGRPPFAGRDANAIAMSVASVSPAPIETLRQGLPRDVIDAVNQMMAQEPASRPASVAEMRRRLAAAIAVAEAPKDGGGKGKRKGMNRAILVVAGVAVAGGVAWWAMRGPADTVAASAPRAAEAPKLTEAGRRFAEILARERALGPVCASNVDRLRLCADDYAHLGGDFSIDDPAVSQAWGRRRELLRTLSAVAADDPSVAQRVDAWMAEIAGATGGARAAAVPGGRDASELAASREAAFLAGDKLIDAEQFNEGLGAMAAWVVAEQAACRGKDASEAERAEVRAGVEALRAAALGVAMRLHADLTVDADVLRTHLPETTLLGGRHSAAMAPDFVRARVRMAALEKLLVTKPGRDRATSRRKSIEAQSAAFQVVRRVAPAPAEGAEHEPWPLEVAKAVDAAYDTLPVSLRPGALTVLAETADAERTAALVARTSPPAGAEGAVARAEAEALSRFAALPPSQDAPRRADAVSKWLAQDGATDASVVLADRDDALRASGVHPVISAAAAEKYLGAWGRDSASVAAGR